MDMSGSMNRNMALDFKRLNAKLVLILLCTLVVNTLTAQDDTLKNVYQEEFDQFKEQIGQEFTQFRNSNDSIFYQFLKESWAEFKLMEDEKAAIPKPVKQPAVKVSPLKPQQIEPKQGKTILEDTGRQIRYQMGPSSYESSKPAKSFYTFNFYGSKIKVFKSNIPKLSTATLDKTIIAGYFEEAVNDDAFNYAAFDLENKAKHSKLNGWGYLRLLQEASATQSQSLNEQILYAWSALIKTGFDARVGFHNNDLFLFVNFDVPVYYKLYLLKEGRKYYLVPFKGQKKPSESIVSYEADYPAELEKVSLVMHENPNFSKKIKSRKITFQNREVSLSYNSHLVDFYKSYPDCELSVYFPPPLSASAMNSLEAFLGPTVENGKPVEQVNALLNFVQHGLSYEADDKQFGYENYLFAEESLFYPFIDCEDRTVLLNQLIHHFTGYKSIALAYPGHVTLAVNVPGNVEGSYIMYKGEKYFVSDPTYIGARCGMLMPEFENEKPEVIEFNM